MNDPNKLIEIARSIDPELHDPEQTLVEALLIVKALAILGVPVIAHEPDFSPSFKERIKKQSAQVPAEHLGLQLKRFLKRKKLKTSVIARYLKVSVSSMHGWMSGKWAPSEKYQEQIKKLIEEGYAETQAAENSQN